jgi:hypothetical protein
MADLPLKTAKIVALTMPTRMAYPLLNASVDKHSSGNSLENWEDCMVIAIRKYRFILFLLSAIFLIQPR